MKTNKNYTISCIIVDDEVSSQKVLEHFVGETNGLNLIATCRNAESAFKTIKEKKNVDLIFLDINMPKESGLDFYKRLVNPPQVIFTTAYPQYALQGFDLNATDYLLKPIAYHRFLEAVEKALSKVSREQKDFIILKENKTLYKVKLDNISYIEAFGDYVKVHYDNKILTVHSTFSKFLENLPPNFLRVHKSFCINLNRMTYLMGNQIGIDEYKIPIGKTYKDEVLKIINP
ncbi:LytR/AlgR family response regulator transcription factor [Winogradskyella sp. A3E31]|uniref:LytR/AlgR family response regulator transcription factor n=1 Tax=Winogradskyella sp. A3E31 TaxID=3349637 RepID=UPI00398A61E1